MTSRSLGLMEKTQVKVELKEVSLKLNRRQKSRDSFKKLFIPGLPVYKKREKFYALNNISMKLYKGEVLGVAGKNGSGKSTLLRTICGVYQPDAGEVSVQGRCCLVEQGKRGLESDLSAEDALWIQAALLGLLPQEVETRIDKIIDFAALHGRMHEPLGAFSTGMISRLNFSIAVNTGFPILLIDEALRATDEAFLQTAKQKIRELARQGCTIVLVSHSMDEISEFCHRAAWLDKGQLIMLGSSQDVTEAYSES
jgi:ABC-type polysaccharide/polyol phosphate transport system ATPase subunit